MKTLIQQAVIKMKNNDQRGFDQLFDMYHKKVYFFCLKKGMSAEDAEEVVQEAFAKIWSSRHSIQPDKVVESYIFTIVKNVIYDEFNRRIKRKAAEDYQVHLLDPQNTTQNTIEHNELKELISQTLEKLPEKRRMVLELSRFKGLSNKEIAKKMNISVKTVESHMTLALQSFSEVLKRSEIISLGLFLLLLS
ncbi:MAG: RNA polymerase sigma-70 factor [Cyclobacteriaceae bacterium]